MEVFALLEQFGLVVVIRELRGVFPDVPAPLQVRGVVLGQHHLRNLAEQVRPTHVLGRFGDEVPDGSVQSLDVHPGGPVILEDIRFAVVRLDDERNVKGRFIENRRGLAPALDEDYAMLGTRWSSKRTVTLASTTRFRLLLCMSLIQKLDFTGFRGGIYAVKESVWQTSDTTTFP